MDLPGLFSEIAIRHLWQGVMIVGIVLLLLAGRRLWSAEQRSWLWTASLFLSALLPIATLVRLPELSLFSRDSAATVTGLPTSVPLSQTQAPLFYADLLAPLAAMAELLPLHLMLSLVVSIWLGVALWKLFGLGTALRHTLRLEATLEPCPLSTDMVPANWPSHIAIMQSEAVDTPMAIGLVRHRVVMPAHLVASLPPHQICHILSHELAHIKRGDLPLALVQRIIEALFWWSPLTWFIAANLREEREMACDDRAVRMNGCSRQYASALIESVGVLVSNRNRRRCDMIAVSAFDHHSRTAFCSRVRRLIGRNYRSEVRFGGVQMAGVGMAGLAVAAMFFLSPRHAFESGALKPATPYAITGTASALPEQVFGFDVPDVFVVQGGDLARLVSLARSSDDPTEHVQEIRTRVASLTKAHGSSVQVDTDFDFDFNVDAGDADCDDDHDHEHGNERTVTASAASPGSRLLSPQIEFETMTETLEPGTIVDLSGDPQTEIIIKTRDGNQTVRRVIRHNSAKAVTITADNGSSMTVTITTDGDGHPTLSMSKGGAAGEVVTLQAPRTAP